MKSQSTNSKELEKIIMENEKLIQENPDNTEAHNLLGKAYAVKGELDKAFEIYNNIIKTFPNNTQALINLGVTSFFMEKQTKLFYIIKEQ